MDFTALVQELGIDKMSPDGQKVIMGNIFRTLNLRVGMRLADSLTDEQKQQLEVIQNEKGNEAALEAMLEMYPQYTDFYQEEIDNIKEETKRVLGK